MLSPLKIVLEPLKATIEESTWSRILLNERIEEKGLTSADSKAKDPYYGSIDALCNTMPSKVDGSYQQTQATIHKIREIHV